MIIRCEVIPSAKKNTVTKLKDDKYEVHLKAKPENNQANELLIKALAEYFTISPTTIRIISGHHTRHKRIEIAG